MATAVDATQQSFQLHANRRGQLKACRGACYDYLGVQPTHVPNSKIGPLQLYNDLETTSTIAVRVGHERELLDEIIKGRAGFAAALGGGAVTNPPVNPRVDPTGHQSHQLTDDPEIPAPPPRATTAPAPMEDQAAEREWSGVVAGFSYCAVLLFILALVMARFAGFLEEWGREMVW